MMQHSSSPVETQSLVRKTDAMTSSSESLSVNIEDENQNEDEEGQGL